ncbi:hypothetical protein JQ600_09725 [Bradyrhizobium sp. AUGA SZCCT0176]|uniref:hypothetical protein n=1 Tax=Bradyrhizobium sp. AUGA SZCCT0176 TaxID=2807664 RepID=UPI001BAA6314|nr:hypothetical protein [Bradyrhizobium sp. AUGA SZCCT0176]MBR1225196.1 hypothetical protein [Bradyrhizobium sp. AUGA SZCCT0176]
MSGKISRPLVDEDTARNMADALTYLGRVAIDAGYHSLVPDILALRDRLQSIAEAEDANRLRRANA